MRGQTIALFRYLLPGIVNRRLLILVFILSLIGILLNGLATELAIIASQQIAAALLAEFLRYSFVLLALLLVATNVAEDFEYRQFERLLTMPVSRWQYIAAQFLIVSSIALILALVALMLLVMTVSFKLALYWAIALGLEIMLVGLLGLLAILSLEKIPQAVFFSLAIYLLAKLSGLINQMLAYAVDYSDASAASRFAEMVFHGILYVMPSLDTFAQNNIFFTNTGMLEALTRQCQSVAVYALFLLTVSMVDFYRKEFNL
ncbi:MAG: hypothetical protein GY820_13430 [Gammaproteobacteria bacterium]|nr:hypothetical protein [Gammaproteobacteria bacterium]